MKKILFTIALLLLTVSGATATTNFNIKETKVRIMTIPGFSGGMPVWYETLSRLPAVAEKNGIKNLVIEEVGVKSSTMGNDMLVGGKLDMVFGAPNNGLLLESKMPGQIKFLTGAHYYSAKLLCQPEIKTVEEAAKHNIVLLQYNGGQHMFAKWLADKHFGDSNALERQLIVLPVTAVIPTFQAKLPINKSSIQCAIVGAPWQNNLLDLGMTEVATSDPLQGTGVPSVVWLKKEWADKNSVLARSIVEALEEAQAYYKTSEGQKKAYARFIEKDKVTGMDVEMMVKRAEQNSESVYTKLSPSLDNFVDFVFRINLIGGMKNKPDIGSLIWDPSILK
jgi:ABC-type nitrate/sulfonate/bicarbonate transport system substrate-binding protein